MQQSETNTLAAALTTMMAGASALSTLANTDIIEVRNSSGALKGKITAQNLAAFAAGYDRLTSVSVTDFDNASPGIYLAAANANTPHSPKSTVIRAWFMCFTHTAYKFQVCIDRTTDVFLRVYNGTAWSDWKKIA